MTTYDGSGLCLLYKRLDRGTFRVPSSPVPDATSIELSERELDDLLDAIAVEPEPTQRPRKDTSSTLPAMSRRSVQTSSIL